jgi:hypothetical protein
MANSNHSKWDYFFRMPLIEFLNAVSFYNQKEQLAKKMLDKYKKG